MPAIATPELKSMMERQEDFLLINTLPRENFEDTKLPGAINIPQDQAGFVEKVEQQAGGKDKTIVVYCASLECHSSTQAAKKLDEAAFTDVHDYRGGAKAWNEDVVERASRTVG